MWFWEKRYFRKWRVILLTGTFSSETIIEFYLKKIKSSVLRTDFFNPHFPIPGLQLKKNIFSQMSHLHAKRNFRLENNDIRKAEFHACFFFLLLVGHARLTAISFLSNIQSDLVTVAITSVQVKINWITVWVLCTPLWAHQSQALLLHGPFITLFHLYVKKVEAAQLHSIYQRASPGWQTQFLTDSSP